MAVLDWKKYNKKIFNLFIVILLSLIFFNVFTDPYNIFDMPKIKYFNAIKSDAGRNQRVTKIVNLKLDKTPLNSVFLGSSRVDATISEKYYNQLTNLNTKNLGMNALSHSETIKVANYVVLVHPEIKKIYVGLDFFRFLERNKDEKREVVIPKTTKLTIAEINPLILSFNTTLSSINTLKANLFPKKKKKEYNPKPEFIRIINQYAKNYKNAELSIEEIKKLKQLQIDMNKKGIEVIFYTNPTHAIDMALIDELKVLSVFNEWKIQLAEHFDYIDFDFINDLTVENVDKNTKYFKESSHGTAKLGEIIVDYLVLKNNSYAKQINKNNVRSFSILNNKQIKNWKINNSEWIEIIKKAVEKQNEKV